MEISLGIVTFSLSYLYPTAFLIHSPFLFPLDINKFLWMVRIGGSTDTGRHIKENDYYTPTGEFRVDREGSPVLLNCLMYKMCYYRFGQVYTEASEWFTILSTRVIANIYCVFQVLLLVSLTHLVLTGAQKIETNINAILCMKKLK